MTVNERIVASAWLAARGKVSAAHHPPGMCLAFTRAVIEHALHKGKRAFYDYALVAGTTTRPGTDPERLKAARKDPWAADAERSAKLLGWGVPFSERQPGDIICNHKAATPYGHIGVLLDVNTVLENISPAYRQASIHLPNSISLTPVSDRAWTLVFRVKPPA